MCCIIWERINNDIKFASSKHSKNNIENQGAWVQYIIIVGPILGETGDGKNKQAQTKKHPIDARPMSALRMFLEKILALPKQKQKNRAHYTQGQ